MSDNNILTTEENTISQPQQANDEIIELGDNFNFGVCGKSCVSNI